MKRTSKKTRPDVYQIITDRIIEKLEDGTVPWTRPWNGSSGMPRNLLTDREYRGINPFLLHSMAFESPYFLTFKQAKSKGGSVRKGEKGCPVIFWKTYDVEDDDAEDGKRTRFVLRYYTVFNVAQCDGIEAPALEEDERREHNPIEAAEAIVEGMPKRPTIEYGRSQAFYSPSEDKVGMPDAERFESGERFYSTLFHELTHSTRHASRLNRGNGSQPNTFGSSDYSKEELCAEMGAAFLNGHVGITDATEDMSASYIKGWLKSLRSDPKMVVLAAAQAHKAADFILDTTTQPRPEKDVEKAPKKAAKKPAKKRTRKATPAVAPHYERNPAYALDDSRSTAMDTVSFHSRVSAFNRRLTGASMRAACDPGRRENRASYVPSEHCKLTLYTDALDPKRVAKAIKHADIMGIALQPELAASEVG